MHSFAIEANDDATGLWRELTQSAEGLVDGEPDAIANMANLSALLWAFLPDINWVGF